MAEDVYIIGTAMTKFGKPDAISLNNTEQLWRIASGAVLCCVLELFETQDLNQLVPLKLNNNGAIDVKDRGD